MNITTSTGEYQIDDNAIVTQSDGDNDRCNDIMAMHAGESPDDPNVSQQMYQDIAYKIATTMGPANGSYTFAQFVGQVEKWRKGPLAGPVASLP